MPRHSLSVVVHFSAGLLCAGLLLPGTAGAQVASISSSRSHSSSSKSKPQKIKGRIVGGGGKDDDD